MFDYQVNFEMNHIESILKPRIFVTVAMIQSWFPKRRLNARVPSVPRAKAK